MRAGLVATNSAVPLPRSRRSGNGRGQKFPAAHQVVSSPKNERGPSSSQPEFQHRGWDKGCPTRQTLRAASPGNWLASCFCPREEIQVMPAPVQAKLAGQSGARSQNRAAVSQGRRSVTDTSSDLRPPSPHPLRRRESRRVKRTFLAPSSIKSSRKPKPRSAIVASCKARGWRGSFGRMEGSRRLAGLLWWWIRVKRRA